MIDINMGFAVILGKKYTKYELIDMLANVLTINKAFIKVINSYDELYDVPLEKEDKVLALLSDVGGNFSQLASFSLSEELKYMKPECFVKNICIYSKTECLLPDEASNCDIDMILFLPDGTKKSVYVNSEAMDRNEYIIEKYTD